jgi:hypothetical protein
MDFLVIDYFRQPQHSGKKRKKNESFTRTTHRQKRQRMVREDI